MTEFREFPHVTNAMLRDVLEGRRVIAPDTIRNCVIITQQAVEEDKSNESVTLEVYAQRQHHAENAAAAAGTNNFAQALEHLRSCWAV